MIGACWDARGSGFEGGSFRLGKDCNPVRGNDIDEGAVNSNTRRGLYEGSMRDRNRCVTQKVGWPFSLRRIDRTRIT